MGEKVRRSFVRELFVEAGNEFVLQRPTNRSLDSRISGSDRNLACCPFNQFRFKARFCRDCLDFFKRRYTAPPLLDY